MKASFLILLGGGLGALSRYWLIRFCTYYLSDRLPWGLLFVNVSGSFLIGLLFGLFFMKTGVHVSWQNFSVVGFLGGFTTFSSFSLLTILLMSGGNILLALSNVLMTLLGCLSATVLGLYMSKMILGCLTC